MTMTSAASGVFAMPRVERAHADERERAGLDRRVVEHELRRERRTRRRAGRRSRAPARSRRRCRREPIVSDDREDLRDREHEQQLDRRPAGRRPAAPVIATWPRRSRRRARRCRGGRCRSTDRAVNISTTTKMPSARPPTAGRSHSGTGSLRERPCARLERRREQRRERRDRRARAARTAAAAWGGTGTRGRWPNSGSVPNTLIATEYAMTLREHGRDQRLGLEVVAIQHLDREERGAERRAEHRRDAGGDAGDHQRRGARAPVSAR